VYVNAHTGQVIGERPYSIPKIMAAVVLGLLVAALLVLAYLALGTSSSSGSVP
jgi:hypothetical protein